MGVSGMRVSGASAKRRYRRSRRAGWQAATGIVMGLSSGHTKGDTRLQRSRPMEYRFPADLQPFVDEMIANGTYPDVHSLILDAVYRHRDYELTRQRKYEELKKDIQIGIDQLDRGE